MEKLENPVLTGFLKGTGVDKISDAFGSVLRTFIEVLILIGIIAFVFHFLLGGIKWITSQGDEAKVKEAREQVTQALIGLVIVFLVFLILKIIGVIFGLTWMETLEIPLPQLVS